MMVDKISYLSPTIVPQAQSPSSSGPKLKTIDSIKTDYVTFPTIGLGQVRVYQPKLAAFFRGLTDVKTTFQRKAEQALVAQHGEPTQITTFQYEKVQGFGLPEGTYVMVELGGKFYLGIKQNKKVYFDEISKAEAIKVQRRVASQRYQKLADKYPGERIDNLEDLPEIDQKMVLTQKIIEEPIAPEDAESSKESEAEVAQFFEDLKEGKVNLEDLDREAALVRSLGVSRVRGGHAFSKSAIRLEGYQAVGRPGLQTDEDQASVLPSISFGEKTYIVSNPNSATVYTENHPYHHLLLVQDKRVSADGNACVAVAIYNSAIQVILDNPEKYGIDLSQYDPYKLAGKIQNWIQNTACGKFDSIGGAIKCGEADGRVSDDFYENKIYGKIPGIRAGKELADRIKYHPGDQFQVLVPMPKRQEQAVRRALAQGKTLLIDAPQFGLHSMASIGLDEQGRVLVIDSVSGEIVPLEIKEISAAQEISIEDPLKFLSWVQQLPKASPKRKQMR